MQLLFSLFARRLSGCSTTTTTTTALPLSPGPQNVERIIALGAPSATGLEELYKTGQLSRHEVESRTIAERKRQAEKVARQLSDFPPSFDRAVPVPRRSCLSVAVRRRVILELLDLVWLTWRGLCQSGGCASQQQHPFGNS